MSSSLRVKTSSGLLALTAPIEVESGSLGRVEQCRSACSSTAGPAGGPSYVITATSRSFLAANLGRKRRTGNRSQRGRRRGGREITVRPRVAGSAVARQERGIGRRCEAVKRIL